MTSGRDPSRREKGAGALPVLRWGMAAAFVAVAHGAGAWVALNWHAVDATPNDPPPAVMIDLAPLAVAPEAPPEEVAPGPAVTEAQPEVTPDTAAPVEDAPPDPAPSVDTAEPVKPDTVPAEQARTIEDVKPEVMPAVQPPEVMVPDLPDKDKAEAVLAPPPPPTPKVHRPPPPKHAAEPKKPIDPHKSRQKQTAAPTTQANVSNRAAAPATGSSSSASVSPATWKGTLLAHLNHYKRYPPGATGAGTASVAFIITRSGQVLSTRLIASSGDAALDAEAVLLPRRASPVPAPPPNIGGGTISLTVPIHFGR